MVSSKISSRTSRRGVSFRVQVPQALVLGAMASTDRDRAESGLVVGSETPAGADPEPTRSRRPPYSADGRHPGSTAIPASCHRAVRLEAGLDHLDRSSMPGAQRLGGLGRGKVG